MAEGRLKLPVSFHPVDVSKNPDTLSMHCFSWTPSARQCIFVDFLFSTINTQLAIVLHLLRFWPCPVQLNENVS